MRPLPVSRSGKTLPSTVIHTTVSRGFAGVVALLAIGAGRVEARLPTAPGDEPRATFRQFTSGRHVLSFDHDGYYVSNGTFALRVRFENAEAVAPVSDLAAEDAPTNAAALSRVAYAGLWKGISVVYDAPPGGIVRSTWSLEPGADPAAIRLRYNRGVRLTEAGNLSLAFELGSMTESRPVAWQEVDGQRRPVEVAFVQLADDVVGFEVGAYRSDLPLTIDPTVTWNTFLGAEGWDFGYGIAVDGSGNVYVSGTTTAAWGTRGAPAPVRAFSYPAPNAFVAKLTPTGTLAWHTFLGGGGDYGKGLALDDSDYVYVVGNSSLEWGTPVRGYSGARTDAWAAKLSPAGALVWNTFLGGASNPPDGPDTDYGNSIAVDGSGDVYVTGHSSATWGSPLRPYAGGWDVFVAKVTPGGALTWNTFLGSSDNEWVIYETGGTPNVAVDGGGNVYVAGESRSTWGSPLSPYAAGVDTFAAKLAPSGTLVWNTFIGGGGDDNGAGIGLDGSGNVYVVGYSDATWGSPVRSFTAGEDVFAAQLASDGTLVWNTFLGGGSADNFPSVAVDSVGNVHVAGTSASTWGSPERGYTAGQDAFAAQLTSTGVLVWNTFLGGSDLDVGTVLALDGSGTVHLTGYSAATWESPLDPFFSAYDAFVVKLAGTVPTATPTGSPTPTATSEDTATATPSTSSTTTATPTDTPPPADTDTVTATPTDTPTPDLCPDGNLDPGEACDDGNAFSGDGCEADCTVSSACTYTHPGTPAEVFVGGCGSPSYADIAAAIAAVGSGDIVSVCPGTYTIPVQVSEEITLRSTGGSALTTIHTSGVAIDVRRSGVRIEGFTLISDSAAAVGANALCPLGAASCAAPGRGSNVTITGNVIDASVQGIAWQRRIDCAEVSGNALTGNAVHIELAQQEGTPAVLGRVVQNTLSGGGTSGRAVAVSGCGPLVAGNTIENSAGAGIVVSAIPAPAQVVIVDNTIRDNATDGVTIGAGAHSTEVHQNNITGNGVGLGNEAPGGVVDATLNWWGSQTGPFHTTERAFAIGDEVQDRSGGLDTTYLEFLCGPAPGGFPSVGGVCDLVEPQDLKQVAFGRSPDVSPNGRFVTFVSDRDQNGDQTLSVDNADGGEEVFVLNRKPSRKPISRCIGGTSPGAVCERQPDCPANFSADPIILEGSCVLITQVSHDATGDNEAFTPRVTTKGDVFFTATADLTGRNADGSREVFQWSRREYRRQEPATPNAVVAQLSDAAGRDSERGEPSGNGAYVVLESTADLAGANVDGNREIFRYDIRRDQWLQVTNTVDPVDNRRPATQTGKRVVFDSTGDLVPGSNGDGNREIFLATAKGGGWEIVQLTYTTGGVENFAGDLSKRGRTVVFTSNGNFTGSNSDGNREVFKWEMGVISQLTDTTAPRENASPVIDPYGRFVAFESTAELVPEDAGATNRRVFLDDLTRPAGSARLRLSRSLFGDNYTPRISNGRFVVWESTANLTGGNPDGLPVIYMFDRRRDD